MALLSDSFSGHPEKRLFKKLQNKKSSEKAENKNQFKIYEMRRSIRVRERKELVKVNPLTHEIQKGPKHRFNSKPENEIKNQPDRPKTVKFRSTPKIAVKKNDAVSKFSLATTQVARTKKRKLASNINDQVLNCSRENDFSDFSCKKRKLEFLSKKPCSRIESPLIEDFEIDGLELYESDGTEYCTDDELA